MNNIKQNFFILLVLFVFILIVSCSNESDKSVPTQGYVVKEKEVCPFDCCTNTDYKIKECSLDYECKSNKCVAIDSDGDGLTDIEEKQIGTNPRLVDTDNDGLTDYQEVKVYHTDPLNPNTDGDRYTDGEEIKLGKNPLIKNSPNIIGHTVNENGEWNWKNIALITTASIGGSLFTGPAVTGLLTTLGLANLEIYKSNVDVYFENIGDDYTKWVNYNVDFYVDGKLIHQTPPDSIGRVEEKSKSLAKSYSVSLTALQTAGQLLNVLNKKAIVEIKVENMEFEKP